MSKKSERAHIRMELNQREFARSVAAHLKISTSAAVREMLHLLQSHLGAKATAEVIRNHRANAKPPDQ